MFDAFVLLLAAAGAQTADPLAPAREGKIQCVAPNQEKKTCMGLVRYSFNADGSFKGTSKVLVAPSPLITMETTSTGTFQNGQVCGKVLRSDYEAAKFEIDGKPVDEATAGAIRAQVVAAMAPMADKNACSKETAEGAVFAQEVTLDGVARPDLSHKTAWVKPDEGYTIGM